MKCPLTLIDKSDKICDCLPGCAALVLVDNGKKAVCGLFANAVLPFEGMPAKVVNWIDADELRRDVEYELAKAQIGNP